MCLSSCAGSPCVGSGAGRHGFSACTPIGVILWGNFHYKLHPVWPPGLYGSFCAEIENGDESARRVSNLAAQALKAQRIFTQPLDSYPDRRNSRRRSSDFARIPHTSSADLSAKHLSSVTSHSEYSDYVWNERCIELVRDDRFQAGTDLRGATCAPRICAEFSTQTS